MTIKCLPSIRIILLSDPPIDPVTRKQLEEGDWDVQLSGGVLDVSKLKYYAEGEFRQRVRYWDFAATEQKEGVDPDWTAGVLMGVEDGAYQVQDVQRFREGPAEVEAHVKSQAQIDGPNVPVRIEQEPGSAGVIVIDHYARHVLPGRDFRGVRSSGSKAERARPLAAAVSNGLVSLRSEAPWVRDLTNEMRSFPLGTHDDQVDAMSGSMTALTQQDRIQSVLPRSMVQLCVDAYRKYEREIGRIVTTERPFVGFRIAETGADRTSMVTRRGPVIVAAEQWDVSALDSLERVDRHCREVGAIALYYDAGGSGAGIRTSLRQLWRERQLSQYPVIRRQLRCCSRRGSQNGVCAGADQRAVLRPTQLTAILGVAAPSYQDQEADGGRRTLTWVHAY